ncbi:MAG: MFS transporter [Lacibacter sp.]
MEKNKPYPQQGLAENKWQFALLVLANAFVGAMVGLERAVMPEYAASRFAVAGTTALTSFIAAFGLTKAIFNLLTGELQQRYTRKQVLLLGWLAGLPVPFMLLFAPHWWVVVAANVLLGMNQGLAWSSTVIMKVDLVGSRNRGLAMGINEFAGYLAVGGAGYLATRLAHSYGAAYAPFIPGIAFAVLGLLLTVFFIGDTTSFSHAEQEQSSIAPFRSLWQAVSFRHFNMGSVTINGFINNLNDGVLWGLLPLWLLSQGYSLTTTGLLTSIYPTVWGTSQLLAGKLGDRYCKKQLISLGMWMQAAGLGLLVVPGHIGFVVLAMVLLGLGTGLVYPNFLTVIAENLPPVQRARGLSYYRFWRDLGYAGGALGAGLLAEILELPVVLLLVAALTAFGGFLANYRMCCTFKLLWRTHTCTEAAAY